MSSRTLCFWFAYTFRSWAKYLCKNKGKYLIQWKENVLESFTKEYFHTIYKTKVPSHFNHLIIFMETSYSIHNIQCQSFVAELFLFKLHITLVKEKVFISNFFKSSQWNIKANPTEIRAKKNEPFFFFFWNNKRMQDKSISFCLVTKIYL